MELLVALALVAAVMALAFPLMGVIRQRTQTARCLHHLRLSGTALLAYAGDRGNRLVALYSGGHNMAAWARMLHRADYLPDKSISRCPDAHAAYTLEDKTWDWTSFGLNLQTPPGKVETIDQDRVYQLAFPAISQPSRHLLLADSINPAAHPPSQTFRLFVSRTAIHLRHDLRANAFFLDGHAESLDESSVQTLVQTARQAGWGTMYYLLDIP